MKRAERMTRDLQPRQKHYEADVKFRILHLFERGYMPPEEIAESFGVSARTLYNWRDAYDAEGMAGLEDALKSGRPALVSLDGIKKAVENVRSRGTITVKNTQEQISRECGVRYSDGHVRDILSRMDMTYKKADPVHRNAATNAEIEEWADENMPVIRECLSKGYVLLSVDEAHPEIDGPVRYGYAESGQRVYATHHGSRQRLNIAGAVASRGRGIFRTQRGRSNSPAFIKFLEALHGKFHRAVVLLDRAAYHTSKSVGRWLQEHPGVIPIYLPVGSPHMNSIENLWGAMDSYLGRFEYASFEEFKCRALYFLRRRAFDLDVRGKLDSRLDPAAEAQVLRTREQLELLQCR